MDTDYFVMLFVLELHRGKSVRLVDGVPSDVDGINDISIDDTFTYMLEKGFKNISIDQLTNSINRLTSKKLIDIKDGRLCPAFDLIYYFVEILQYTEDITERLKMLSARLKNS